MPPKLLKIFQQKLLKWFEQEQRPLPWREQYLPYQVWISEMMLQQTQVVTVLPYYQRWMTTLPDIQAVANASDDQLHKLWQGLGYYQRVRNIQKAARQIITLHAGKFPESYSDILALAGIGRYTAGAIASIAFEQDYPVVDGNVVRVLCRLQNWKENPKQADMQEKLWDLAQKWLPQGRARDFNQSLMEFGATVCRPKQPNCLLCPINEFCAALAAGTVEQIPSKGPTTKINTVLAIIAVVVNPQQQILLQQRSNKGLMAGLWEFPHLEATTKTTVAKHIQRELEHTYHIQVQQIKKFFSHTHYYTNNKSMLVCYTCTWKAGIPTCPPNAQKLQWVNFEQLIHLPMPSAQAKILAKLYSQVAPTPSA